MPKHSLNYFECPCVGSNRRENLGDCLQCRGFTHNVSCDSSAGFKVMDLAKMVQHHLAGKDAGHGVDDVSDIKIPREGCRTEGNDEVTLAVSGNR